MDMSPDSHLGHMIRGYQLDKKLGTGKLTELYRARTEELWLPPELVIMLIHLPASCSQHMQAQFAERFQSLARQLIKLRHPSLHPLLGYGEEDGYTYLLFPSSEGVTLAQHRQTQQTWNPSDVFTLFAPLSNALDYIHQNGHTYTFLTPTNILLQENAASGFAHQPEKTPLITGLGLLQLVTMHGLDEELDNSETENHLKNITGDYMSTATYLAPEVIRGTSVDGRADVYSLGVMIFELLAGRTPFVGDSYKDIAWKHLHEPLPSLHTVAPDVPIALERVINRALHRDPAHRFSTAGDLISAFSQALDEQRIIAGHHLPGRELQKGDTPAPMLAAHVFPPTQQAEKEQTTEEAPASIDDPATEIPPVLEQSEQPLPASSDADEKAPPIHSVYKDIDKMAQQMQRLRQRIQGEYIS
jgi:serine/threonine protein kinase